MDAMAGMRYRQRPLLLDVLCQVRPFDELHDEEMRAASLVGVESGAAMTRMSTMPSNPTVPDPCSPSTGALTAACSNSNSRSWMITVPAASPTVQRCTLTPGVKTMVADTSAVFDTEQPEPLIGTLALFRVRVSVPL